MTRRCFYHYLIKVIVPFIALWTNVFRLHQSPEIMPHGSVFVNVGGICAIVFGNYFCAAATGEDAGYCGNKNNKKN